MAKVIHKQIVDLPSLKDVVSLEMPMGAEILSVDNQHEMLAFWYMFDESEDRKEMNHFRIAGTGHKITDTPGFIFTHLGTVKFQDGYLVFHVFGISEPPF